MFSVVFEVLARSEEMDAYFIVAGSLRPELEKIVGFVDNIRYRSLTKDGWRLSLSTWDDEKALVRWRTQSKHHNAQELGRGKFFHDYHLRVGQNTLDTNRSPIKSLPDQRMDETEIGQGTTLTLMDIRLDSDQVDHYTSKEIATLLETDSGQVEGLTSWDIYENVAVPGEILFVYTWKDEAAAEAFESLGMEHKSSRLRRVRVVRDYGMFDRREAPQYYPEITREESARA